MRSPDNFELAVFNSLTLSLGMLWPDSPKRCHGLRDAPGADVSAVHYGFSGSEATQTALLERFISQKVDQLWPIVNGKLESLTESLTGGWCVCEWLHDASRFQQIIPANFWNSKFRSNPAADFGLQHGSSRSAADGLQTVNLQTVSCRLYSVFGRPHYGSTSVPTSWHSGHGGLLGMLDCEL